MRYKSSILFWAFLTAIPPATIPAYALPSPASGASRSVTVPPNETLSFGVWVDELTEILDAAPSLGLDKEYREFVLRHGLPGNDATLERDYRRLRLLFEAVRDGGFWHLRWAVTDKMPSSRLIWRQWSQNPVRTGFTDVSATAECDESSALIGMLARHLRVHSVGLFYPAWNHTIAAWAPLEGKTKLGLIQLPTTQIFLECSAGFGRTSFPTQLKNLERYPNFDLRPQDKLPRARAEWLLSQVRNNSSASPALWSLVRAKRAYLTHSTMGPCHDEREQWYRQIVEDSPKGNRRALEALAKEELGDAAPNIHQTLAWLKE